MNRSNDIFDRIEHELNNKLSEKGFQISSTRYDEEVFGSRYTIWKNNNEQLAMRLTWDGKESWFIVEESPFKLGNEPISWADLVIVPFDRNVLSDTYDEQTLRDVVNEIE